MVISQHDVTAAETVRIGSLRVLLGLPIPADFAGLHRLSATRPANAASVRLDLVPSKKAAWPTGLRRSGDGFTKGLATHATEMNFPDRTIRIRIVTPVTPSAVYRVMRDIFCGLGGLCGDVILHGATALHHGQAMIFCAASGGGKSTLAGLLAPQVEIVNDEIIWIRRNRAGRWLAVNQGFWGLPPSTAPAEIPVRAVYLLEKADACRIVPTKPGAVFAQLLTAPFGGHDPQLPARAAQTARFLEAIPLHRLYFTRDAAALQEILFQSGSKSEIKSGIKSVT